jgi:hypothetical protein
MYIESENNVPTIKAVRFIISQMRWADLEILASDIEGMRAAGSRNCRRAVSAEIVYEAAKQRRTQDDNQKSGA